MGRMRQVVVALAAAAVLGAPAAAQQGQGQGRPQRDGIERGTVPGAMARNPVAALLERREELELTADQVRQLEVISARVEAENAARIEQLREIRETNRTAMDEVRGILTAEQTTRLRDAMSRRGIERGRRGQGEAGALPVPFLLAQREALGLTAEQVARLEAVREILTDEQEAKLRELMAERRAGRGERPARGRRPGGRL